MLPPWPGDLLVLAERDAGDMRRERVREPGIMIWWCLLAAILVLAVTILWFAEDKADEPGEPAQEASQPPGGGGDNPG